MTTRIFLFGALLESGCAGKQSGEYLTANLINDDNTPNLNFPYIHRQLKSKYPDE